MDRVTAAAELAKALRDLATEVSEANADRVAAALDALAVSHPAPAPATEPEPVK